MAWREVLAQEGTEAKSKGDVEGEGTVAATWACRAQTQGPWLLGIVRSQGHTSCIRVTCRRDALGGKIVIM